MRAARRPGERPAGKRSLTVVPAGAPTPALLGRDVLALDARIGPEGHEVRGQSLARDRAVAAEAAAGAAPDQAAREVVAGGCASDGADADQPLGKSA